MNAGQIIGQTLRPYGIEYFFAITGGDQDIWLGLRDAGIKYVLPRSERSGVAMADAYNGALTVEVRPFLNFCTWAFCLNRGSFF